MNVQPDPSPGIIKRRLSDAGDTIREFKKARAETPSPEKLKENLQAKLTQFKAAESYTKVRPELLSREIKKTEWQLLAAQGLVSKAKIANFFRIIGQNLTQGKGKAVEKVVDALLFKPYGVDEKAMITSFIRSESGAQKLYQGLRERISKEKFDTGGVALRVQEVGEKYITDKVAKANLATIVKQLKSEGPKEK